MTREDVGSTSRLTDTRAAGSLPFDVTRGASSRRSGSAYFVSTLGRDEKVIREYIRRQEEEDKRLDPLNLLEMTATFRWPRQPGPRQRPHDSRLSGSQP